MAYEIEVAHFSFNPPKIILINTFKNYIFKKYNGKKL